MSRFAPLLFALIPAAAMAAGPWPAHPSTTPAITAADLSARVRAISADAFEGRGPGTVSGEAAAQWIADELKRLGIKPANRSSYFQSVPTVSITLDAKASSLSFATPKGRLVPKLSNDISWGTPRFASPDVKVANAPVVFAGYGVVAPEYGWNDYAGMDVKGKTVIVLVNDPGNEDASPDPKLFKGKAMTYYGRWTYKYEEAARQGAAAVLVVHETKPAAYGWQVVRDSWSGPDMMLEAADKNASRAAVQGWITHEFAAALLARAGLDYATLKAAANKRGFRALAVPGTSLSATAHTSISRLTTRNVVGIIEGAQRPDEVVIYSAHWDHLGRNPAAPGADKIFNGAVDNGMGISQVLELAEKWKAEKPPARSIVFAFWTLEEQGLLGSQYFGDHPLWPRNRIVGVVNLDDGGPQPRARDIQASGTGQSEMEDVLRQALKLQGRTLSPDPEPEKGLFFRSDHFSLAKYGIPAISPGGGRNLVKGGVAAGQKLADDYTEHRYHQPTDEWKADWDLSGPAQDAEVYFLAGAALASGSTWPNYYKSSEFRALRDKDMARR